MVNDKVWKGPVASAFPGAPSGSLLLVSRRTASPAGEES